MTFCVWLISLSTMLSRFTHAAAHERTTFLFNTSNISVYVHTTPCPSIPHWMDTRVASTLGYYEYCGYEYSCTNCCRSLVFNPFGKPHTSNHCTAPTLQNGTNSHDNAAKCSKRLRKYVLMGQKLKRFTHSKKMSWILPTETFSLSLLISEVPK